MSDTFTRTLKMKPPTIANWITAKSDDLETLTQCANDSYPILHENVLLLCQDFLRFKLEQGTPIEKNLYEKLTLITFIDRLIKKVIMIHRGHGCQFDDCAQCTEVRFASLLSGGFTTVAVINPPKKKLANCISVH